MLSVPAEISRRTLPPLSISKRKLPLLQQSETAIYHTTCNAAVHEQPVSSHTSTSTITQSIRVLITNIHQRIVSPTSQSPQKGRKTFHFPTVKSKWRPKLEYIFVDKQLLTKLKNHMTRQHNEENLLFLQSVYKLNVLIDNLLLFSSDLNVVKHAQINNLIASIYDQYVQTNAEKQINVSYASFNNVITHQFKFREYSLSQKRDLFKECMVEIEKLIQMSILSGFYLSDDFQSVARARKIFSNSVDPEYMLLATGYSSGIHEWKIEILHCNNARQNLELLAIVIIRRLN